MYALRLVKPKMIPHLAEISHRALTNMTIVPKSLIRAPINRHAKSIRLRKVAAIHAKSLRVLPDVQTQMVTVTVGINNTESMDHVNKSCLMGKALRNDAAKLAKQMKEEDQQVVVAAETFL